MATGSTVLGPIGSAHFERWHEVRRQAFGATDRFDPDFYSLIPAERVLGAFVDGTLMAATVIHPYRQTWGRSQIDCGGVSGVVVAPEARGRGLARRLVHAHLDDMRARGEVLAALYPTTASLYRSLGFEVAGQYATRSLPHATIPDAGRDDVAWDRVTFDDPRLATVDALAAERRNGWLTRGHGSWRRKAAIWAAEESVNRFAYVGRRGGHDIAALVYHYVKPERGTFGVFYALETDVVAATDPGAWAATLAFMAAQSTTSADIVTDLPESALQPLLSHPQRARVVESIPWMLRLVDPARAIAARATPSSLTGRVEVEIDDGTIADNSGAWTLEASGGHASLTPGGSGRCRLSVGTLSRVFAGADIRGLANSGALPGATEDDLQLLAAMFAGRPEIQFFF